MQRQPGQEKSLAAGGGKAGIHGPIIIMLRAGPRAGRGVVSRAEGVLAAAVCSVGSQGPGVGGASEPGQKSLAGPARQTIIMNPSTSS